jgi:hypothetical protein
MAPSSSSSAPNRQTQLVSTKDMLVPCRHPTREDWEAKKPVIEDLYMTQNLTLKDVVEHMETLYAFKPTSVIFPCLQCTADSHDLPSVRRCTRTVSRHGTGARTKRSWMILTLTVLGHPTIISPASGSHAGPTTPDQLLRLQDQRNQSVCLPSVATPFLWPSRTPTSQHDSRRKSS